MKPLHKYQEILVFTNTKFTKATLCKKDGFMNTSSFMSDKDYLEEACWNGLLPELLPEITKTSIVDNHLMVWRIYQGYAFLHIELAMGPTTFEAPFSIAPDVCIAVKNKN